MGKLRDFLRNQLLDRDEKHLLAFGKAVLLTDEYIIGMQEQEISKYPTVENDIKNEFVITDFMVMVDGFRFGWIQHITINVGENTAEVGHFAVDKKIVGTGFGKRMAVAFGHKIQMLYGVNKVIFWERSDNPIYPRFFEKTLEAQKIKLNEPGREKWLWEIPTAVSKFHSKHN
jgi:hypothetical protein